jgi:hypothetical protein
MVTSLEEQTAIKEVSSLVLNTYVIDSIVVCEGNRCLLIVGLLAPHEHIVKIGEDGVEFSMYGSSYLGKRAHWVSKHAQFL